MLQVIEVASVESTGPLWSVSVVQAPVIVVSLVAVTIPTGIQRLVVSCTNSTWNFI